MTLFYPWFFGYSSARRPVMARALFSLCLLSGWGAGRARAQNAAQVPAAPKAAVGGQVAGAPKPDLRVEYFGAERGYSVGTEHVSILFILRNAGTAPVPANSVRLYCYPLVGLDYISGEIKPALPEIAPGQSVAFRWPLAPSNRQSKLLTAVMMQRNTPTNAPVPDPVPNSKEAPGGAVGAPLETDSGLSDLPRSLLAPIPHFVNSPNLGNIRAGSATGILAAARPGESWLANDRVSLHVRSAVGGDAVLSLGAKEGTNWRALAMANSLVEILSSEDGQKAWWHRFHWLQTSARPGKDEGTITLTGTEGERWTVEFVVTAHRDTGVIDGKILLMARQNTRLFGIRLPGLLVQNDAPGGGLGRADGRAIVLPTEDLTTPEAPRLVAAHRGGITFGLTWSSHPPLEGWTTDAQLTGNSSLVASLAGTWSSLDRGDLILAGATIEIPFRYFAYTPSDTIHDAQRAALP